MIRVLFVLPMAEAIFLQMVHEAKREFFYSGNPHITCEVAVGDITLW